MPLRPKAALPRTAAALALTLTGAACFVDEDPAEASSASVGASESASPTGEVSTTESSGQATTVSSTAGSTGSASATATTTGASTTWTSGTTGGPGTTTGLETTDASTTEPPAICGNGEVEPGEACDDGNSSDLDACLSTCAVASCDDGVRSQDETDVDCGGSCPPCGLCGGCVDTGDCAVGKCAENDRCVVTFAMTIDYSAHCTEPNTPSKSASIEVPSGDYTASATPGSAGSVWSPPYTPPTKGWAWRAPCEGVEFAEMRTPSGVYYGTQAEAFDALMAPSEAFTVTGDLLTCGVTDSVCSDNQGSVSFSARSLCE